MEMEDIGKHYHDHFQRFWYIFFTHNTSKENFRYSYNPNHTHRLL